MSKTVTESSQRMYYVDNIRVYLTILVILHHVAIAYGGSGDWFLREPPTDPISPVIFLFFTALNQSYFMSFFFILAGYFTPQSLEKKGPAEFMKGRLTRLGVPLLFYVFFLAPFTYWVLAYFTENPGVSFFSFWRDAFTVTSLQDVSFGHLWFLEVLLVFAIGYVVNTFLKGNRAKPVYQNCFPGNRVIIIWVGLLSVTVFLVRVWFPINTWVFGVQPAHMVGYLFSFIVGVFAYRGGWFEYLSGQQAWFWGKIAILNTVALPVTILLSGRNIDLFLGGFTWQSILNAIWESVSFMSIVISLLYVFKAWFNKENRLLIWMSANVFGVYIFHPVVIVALMVPLLGVSLPSVAKFIIVSALSILLSFLLSHLVKQIPYANRVL